jgi:hypothetical protein
MAAFADSLFSPLISFAFWPNSYGVKKVTAVLKSKTQ